MWEVRLPTNIKIMDLTRKEKIEIIITLVVALAALLAVIFGSRLFYTGLLFYERQVVDERPTARNAFDIALLEARKWQTDAELALLNSGESGNNGKSDYWKLIFISGSNKGKGYQVEVNNYKITSAAEIPFIGKGADFPVDIISPEEAILRLRQLNGRQDAKILGVEAIYDANAKTWFWGVKTDRGVVAIPAAK